MKLAWAILVGFAVIGYSKADESRKDDGLGRFTGGEDALNTPGYLVTIVSFFNLFGGGSEEDYRFCQGALINASLILTTASCMNDILYGIVIAGAPSANPEFFFEAVDSGAQISYVQQMYIKPSWGRNTDVDDIAMIRVFPHFNLSSGADDTYTKVTTIKIGSKKLVFGDALLKAKDLTWVSVGANPNDAFLYPQFTQFASVNYMPSKACAAYLKPSPFYYKLPYTIMCLNMSSTIGMCRGDGGSLLVASDPKTGAPYLAGLAVKDRDNLCPLNQTAVNLHTPDLFVKFSSDIYKWIYMMGGPLVK